MRSNKKRAFCIFWVGLCRYPDRQTQPWLALVQALAEQQVMMHIVLLVAVSQGSSVGNVWRSAIFFSRDSF